MIDTSATLPGVLTDRERELLLWVLPGDRPGYAEARRRVEEWPVAAMGRRGPGNLILAPPDARIDNESPLPQVLSYGVVETDQGMLSVTVREPMESQLEFEIAKLGAGEIVPPFREFRRWTYASWNPGEPCPQCGTAVRSVSMGTASGRRLVLALCARDKRLWVHDEESRVTHPVPVTNFYNELMLQRRMRDPAVALHPERLFASLAEYRDDELARAFRSYNMIRTKVPLRDEILVPVVRRRHLWERFRSLFGISQAED